eukprot:3570447-Pleurochrysis_carterae.AAC.1
MHPIGSNVLRGAGCHNREDDYLYGYGAPRHIEIKYWKYLPLQLRMELVHMALNVNNEPDENLRDLMRFRKAKT